jgi:thiamine biosynthesis lipoprotein
VGIRLTGTVLWLILLAGCNRDPEPVRHRLAAFGTDVTIAAHAAPGLDEAVAGIDRELRRMHRRWHAWEPGMLEDINRAIAERRGIELQPDTIAIMEQARALERLSEGLFNPAIGRLLELWGFHASELSVGPPPPDRAIERLVRRSPSLDDLRIEGGRLTSDNPAVQLDFGAYIKGVAVERALDGLAAAGIEHAIVNAGGDLGVIGRRGRRPWRAAVQHPDGRGGRFLATVDVQHGEFVFTSGNYRRYRQSEGIRHGHIIDPRDGYPADAVSAVTVIDTRGGRADAAATALAVAGPGEWPRIAARLGIEKIMRVDAAGTIWITPSMQRRIRWRQQPDTVRIVDPSAEPGSAP